MTAAPKLCNTCKHFRAKPQDCLHPSNDRPSLIDGTVKPHNSLEFLRMSAEDCGLSAKWWEAKP